MSSNEVVQSTYRSDVGCRKSETQALKLNSGSIRNMIFIAKIRGFLTVTLLLLIELTWTNSLVAKPDIFATPKIESTKVIPSHVFIFGLGYTGLALASSLKSKFPDCLISGTCRSISKAENLRKFGIQTHIFDPDADESGLDDLGVQALLHATHIVTMIPPVSDFDKDPVLYFHRIDILNNVVANSRAIVAEDKSDERYNGINDDIYEDDIDGYGRRMEQNLLDEGAGRLTAARDGLWIGYVSTTGVYGDHSGDWVTERSATLAPSSSKAFHRITAENDWLALRPSICDSQGFDTGESNVPKCLIYPHVFRLAGIYGPGRSALDTVRRAATLKQRQQQESSGEVRKEDEKNKNLAAEEVTENWVSRVHVADICGAIIESMVAPVICSRSQEGHSGVGAEVGMGMGMGVGSVYNVADDTPAPREEVMKFAQTLLLESEYNLMQSSNSNSNSSSSSDRTSISSAAVKGKNDDPVSKLINRSASGDSAIAASISGITDQGERNVGERARRRATENKRVDNKHLVNSLKYVLKYPSYKEGLRSLASGSKDPFE